MNANIRAGLAALILGSAILTACPPADGTAPSSTTSSTTSRPTTTTTTTPGFDSCITGRWSMGNSAEKDPASGEILQGGWSPTVGHAALLNVTSAGVYTEDWSVAAPFTGLGFSHLVRGIATGQFSTNAGLLHFADTTSTKTRTYSSRGIDLYTDVLGRLSYDLSYVCDDTGLRMTGGALAVEYRWHRLSFSGTTP